MKKPGMVTKITNAAAILIGASPVIEDAKRFLLDGGGNFQGFANSVKARYTGINDAGQFDINAALSAYAPLAGAFLFKKAISFLRRHARV